MSRIVTTALALFLSSGCATTGVIDVEADVNGDGVIDDNDTAVGSGEVDGTTTGTDETGDSTNTDEDDPPEDIPTVSPWEGQYIGAVALEVQSDWNDFEFCHGEVTVDIDADGLLSGTADCWTGWGGGTGDPVVLTFEGTVAENGETAGHVVQTLPYSGATDSYDTEGEFWMDGFELFWDGQITMGGGPGGGTPRDFEGGAWQE